jgi:hypothetical protein
MAMEGLVCNQVEEVEAFEALVKVTLGQPENMTEPITAIPGDAIVIGSQAKEGIDAESFW